MKASSIAAIRPTGGIGLKMNKTIDMHAHKHAVKSSTFLLGLYGSGTNSSYSREEKGSIDVVIRPCHKLAPSLRPFKGILSVMAMLRQLPLLRLQ